MQNGRDGTEIDAFSVVRNPKRKAYRRNQRTNPLGSLYALSPQNHFYLYSLIATKLL
jgi:hypothetical protein